MTASAWWNLTGTDFDFSALNEVDDSVREEILEELEPETVAEGVRELESDDAVELLEGLDEEDQEEILEKLPPSERDALERSLEYPENSAGRRMQTEFIAVPPDWTVGQAIDYMRDTPESAAPVLRNLCGRQRAALAGRGVAGCVAARAQTGAAGRSDR
jgi:Mg/Co/Ni transporter MgtE